ncbi:hypothetical protein ACM91X_002593 [Cronobacter dublinensis]
MDPLGLERECYLKNSPKNNAQIPDELEAMKKAVNNILDSNGLPLLVDLAIKNFWRILSKWVKSRKVERWFRIGRYTRE